jgi:hypothetical protein
MIKRCSVSKIAVVTVSFLLATSVLACNGSLSAVLSLFSPAPSSTPQVSATLSTTSLGGTVRDYVSLMDNLRTQGATVNPTGDISQPFFAVDGKTIDVNRENVQVFEYQDENAAEADAAQVAPDGGSIGTTMATWMGTPHFYKKGKLIVLYVGDNKQVMSLLTSALGTQFAGR